MGDNRLVINNEKTHLLVMGTKRQAEARKLVRIDTGTVVISPVETEKLLGINIHQSLKWHEHVMFLSKRGNSKLWLLRRLKNLGAPKNILLDMYNKQIRSILEYASPV